MDPELGDENAIKRADRSRNQERRSERCEARETGVQQKDGDSGTEAEHRADREIEIAGDHEKGHANRDDAELGRQEKHIRHDPGSEELVGENRKEHEDTGGR